jgi:hypothetical protein
MIIVIVLLFLIWNLIKEFETDGGNSFTMNLNELYN